MRNTHPQERDCYGGRYDVTPVAEQTFPARYAHFSHVLLVSPVSTDLARPLL